jgi:hypothetical protein
VKKLLNPLKPKVPESRNPEVPKLRGTRIGKFDVWMICFNLAWNPLDSRIPEVPKLQETVVRKFDIWEK